MKNDPLIGRGSYEVALLQLLRWVFCYRYRSGGGGFFPYLADEPENGQGLKQYQSYFDKGTRDAAEGKGVEDVSCQQGPRHGRPWLLPDEGGRGFNLVCQAVFEALAGVGVIQDFHVTTI